MRFRKRTHIAAKVILQDDIGRVLVLRRSATDKRRPLTWDLPGGNVEYGTDPAEAITREVAEETGITGIKELVPLAVDSSYGKDTKAKGRNRTVYVVRLLFTAKVDTYPLGPLAPVVPVLSYEHDSYRWLSAVAEAEALDMPDRYRKHVVASLLSRA